MERKKINIDKGKILLSNDVYSIIIAKLVDKKGLLFEFVLFQVYLVCTNYLLYVLTKSVWNQSTESVDQPVLDPYLIMGIQLIAVFLILVSLTNEIVLFWKMIAIQKHIDTNKLRKLIICSLSSLQFFISLTSCYIFLLKLVIRI